MVVFVGSWFKKTQNICATSFYQVDHNDKTTKLVTIKSGDMLMTHLIDHIFLFQSNIKVN